MFVAVDVVEPVFRCLWEPRLTRLRVDVAVVRQGLEILVAQAQTLSL